ncbi:hypothetical protein DOY81_003674 [Sarcophaga bullata]|nr:hypothetical protein DOY81_003674 [Sarcophaga bullata]
MSVEDVAIEDVEDPSKSLVEAKEFSRSALGSGKMSKKSSPTTKITLPALQAKPQDSF